MLSRSRIMLVMNREKAALLYGVIGGSMAPLILAAGIDVLGSQKLWLPMRGGGEEINPHYFGLCLWIIPLTAILGVLLGYWFHNEAATLIHKVQVSFKSWLVASFISYVVFYQGILFLGYFNPLLICIIGLLFSVFMIWASNRVKSK